MLQQIKIYDEWLDFLDDCFLNLTKQQESMGVERKCNQCGTWNNADVCASCGAELNPKRIRVQKIREVQKQKALEEPSRLEKILARWKNTRNPFLKMAYWIGYSVWMIYMAILSLIAFAIAWGPG